MMMTPRVLPQRREGAGPLTRPLATALVAGLTCTAIPGASSAVPSAAAQAAAPEDSAADPSGAAGADVPDVLRVRDTSGCPYRVSPPEPVTETEAPKPGESAPEPLPVHEPPAGGERMGDCDVVAADGYAVPGELGASAWIVADVGTGEVLATKDPHGRYRPASIAKVLLALVAFRDLPLDRKVETTAEDESIEGSRVGIQAGATFTVEELLLGLLMNSGNDCANALARELGGHDVTLEKVNSLAAELGATDTRIVNYDGLDAAGQSTSAYDMALFYRAAFGDPDFRRLASTRLAELPTATEGERFATSNDNGLLIHDYPGALGGKTGYTDDARHTFAGVAEQDGRTLVTVVLDTPAATLRPWEESWRLLDAGFAAPAGASVGELDAATDEVPGDAPEEAAGGPDGAIALASAAVLVAAGVVAAVVVRRRRSA